MIGHRSISRIFLILLGLAPAIQAQDSPLSLADLEAYRIALASKPDHSAPTVRFKDLWDRPEAYVGKVVTIEGRVARLFRQPKLGEFPPLVEAWVVSPAGDPFCLVFPSGEETGTPEIGGSIRFSGTFLKRIEYRGGDVPRVAPLIVGPQVPSVPRASGAIEGMSWSSIDWMMAIVACLVVGSILARRHFARPPSLPPSLDPPPSFVDGEPEPEGDFA